MFEAILRVLRPAALLQIVRAFAQTALVLAIVLAATYLIENWRGANRWENLQTELIKRGEHVDWKSFAPPLIPAEENAAAHPFLHPFFEYKQTRVRHPNGGIDTRTVRLNSNGLKRLNAVSLWRCEQDTNISRSFQLSGLTDLTLWQSCLRSDTNFPATARPDSPAQDVLFALKRFEPQLSELHDALSRPRCRFTLTYDERPSEMLLPHLNSLKAMAGVLRLRAAASMDAGDAELAFDDARDIFRLAGTLRGEPTSISYLVRLSIHEIARQALLEGITRQTWSDSQLRQFQSILAEENLLAEWVSIMKAEAASALQGIETIRRDGGFVMYGCFGPEGCRQFVSLWWAPKGWFDQNRASLVEHWYHQLLPSVDLQSHRVFPKRALAAATARSSITPYTALARMMASGAQSRHCMLAARAQTLSDCSMIGCALTRYRQADGKFPNTLSHLVPEYISSLPPDVISGDAIKYRIGADKHISLWSVGWNETDDGGRVVRTKWGSVSREEGDWVWELPPGAR